MTSISSSKVQHLTRPDEVKFIKTVTEKSNQEIYDMVNTVAGQAYGTVDKIFGVILDVKALKDSELMVKDFNAKIERMNPDNSSQLFSINNSLNYLNKKILAERPSLIDKEWDFALTNGHLKVTKKDNIDEIDVKWLEVKLNSNKLLVDAVNSFHQSVVNSAENSVDNPSFNGDGTVIPNSLRYSNVAQQLNGKLEIKKLIDDITDFGKPGKRAESGSYVLGSPNQTPFEIGVFGGMGQHYARQYLTMTKGDTVTYNPYVAEAGYKIFT